MPRQNRRRSDAAVDTDAAAIGRGAVRREQGQDGDWCVRAVTGAAATKTYRCPGCDQEIRPAVPHLVVWPEAVGAGLTERRHWHNPCWEARGRRAPRDQRGHGAPRH